MTEDKHLTRKAKNKATTKPRRTKILIKNRSLTSRSFCLTYCDVYLSFNDIVWMIIVKRAQEVMMFGNQQNKPRIKKSDPDVPALADLKGRVTAHKAEDIAEDKPAELPKAIEKELEHVSDDVTEPKESEDVTSESGEPTTDELLEDFPPETVEALKELENAKNGQEEKSKEDESDNTASEKSSEEELIEDKGVQKTGDNEDMIELLPEEWYSKCHRGNQSVESTIHLSKWLSLIFLFYLNSKSSTGPTVI